MLGNVLSPDKILPGDKLHLVVPPGHFLPRGSYTVRVTAVRPGTHHWNQRLTVSMIDPDHASIISVPVYTPIIPRFTGYVFLGTEEYPVECTHEPDLLRRVISSIKPKRLAKVQPLKKGNR